MLPEHVFIEIRPRFCSENDKKRYVPALHFDSAVLKIGTLPEIAGECQGLFFRGFSYIFLKHIHHSSLVFFLNLSLKLDCFHHISLRFDKKLVFKTPFVQNLSYQLIESISPTWALPSMWL